MQNTYEIQNGKGETLRGGYSLADLHKKIVEANEATQDYIPDVVKIILHTDEGYQIPLPDSLVDAFIKDLREATEFKQWRDGHESE